MNELSDGHRIIQSSDVYRCKRLAVKPAMPPARIYGRAVTSFSTGRAFNGRIQMTRIGGILAAVPVVSPCADGSGLLDIDKASCSVGVRYEIGKRGSDQDHRHHGDAYQKLRRNIADR